MTISKFAAPMIALAAALFSSGHLQASVLTATGVDSDLGGTMNLATGTTSYSSGVFTIPITATNSSGTQSYQSVGLALEFIFPTSPAGTGFNYINTGSNWLNPADGAQEVHYASVSPFTLISQSLSASLIDVPLTHSFAGFNGGPLTTSDSVPLVQLGDFAPGQVKNFTLTANSVFNTSFPFHTSAFFVAVPEPSSLLLAGFGALAMIAVKRRRNQSEC